MKELENIETSYFDIPKVSASFMEEVDKWLKDKYLLENFTRTEFNSDSMQLGTFIHNCIEFGDDYYNKLMVLEEDQYVKFSAEEERVIEENDITVEGWCRVNRKGAKPTAKTKAVIEETLTELNKKLEKQKYIDDIKEEGFIILNDYFPNPSYKLNDIGRCYLSLTDYLDNIDLKFEKEVEFEKEIEGIECKGKVDLYNPKLIIDIKTYDYNIHSNIFKFSYLRRLDFYKELTEVDKVAILAVCTRNYEVTYIEFQERDLIAAREGGVYKPSFMTLKEKGNYFYTLSDKQIESLDKIGFIDTNHIKEEKAFRGWKELLDIIKKNNLQEKI